MSIFKLLPSSKNYLWGAESWTLSCHPEGLSAIANGANQGVALRDWLAQHPEELGFATARFPYFPLLLKIIEAKESLSVQVHPDDAYALRHEGQLGKMEMWHILQRTPGATLYLGWQRSVTKEEIAAAVGENRLTALLHSVAVEPGDTFLIQPGTVHAIGGGITLVEIQQSSNLTYRLFDYSRRDREGKLRELHLNKALAVIKTEAAVPTQLQPTLPVTCPYFRVERQVIQSAATLRAPQGSFTALFILSGRGEIQNGSGTIPFAPYDTFYIGADHGEYRIKGPCSTLSVSVPSEKA